jgi:hypothetical protein
MSSEIEQDAPPVGEEIHLPGPTLIPIVSALGISLMVVSTTLGLVFLIPGAILFLITTVLWLRDTRRAISELPEDHTQGHH